MLEGLGRQVRAVRALVEHAQVLVVAGESGSRQAVRVKACSAPAR